MTFPYIYDGDNQQDVDKKLSDYRCEGLGIFQTILLLSDIYIQSEFLFVKKSWCLSLYLLTKRGPLLSLSW